MRGGEPGLQRDDALGGGRPLAGLGFFAVDEREHRGDVARIGGEDLGVLFVAVVGLVGQSQPRLAQVQKVAGGVLGVGVDVGAGPAADAGVLQRAHHRSQRDGIGGGVDRGQLVEQGLHTDPLDGGLVHEARVQVPDALLVCALLGVGRGRLVDELADLLLGAVVERPERAVGGPVRRDRVIGQPAAVHVAEEVVLRAGLLIDVAEVDTGVSCFYRHPNRVPEGR